MDKSNTIKSGHSAFAFSIASRPSAASPHTVQPWNSMIFRRVRRITALSSTTKIRFATIFYYGPSLKTHQSGSMGIQRRRFSQVEPHPTAWRGRSSLDYHSLALHLPWSKHWGLKSATDAILLPKKKPRAMPRAFRRAFDSPPRDRSGSAVSHLVARRCAQGARFQRWFCQSPCDSNLDAPATSILL